MSNHTNVSDNRASHVQISKTKSSFYRRLYIAWLIANDVSTVPAIIALTKMPRRTAQDTISALNELDITCRFEQAEGERHHQGAYHIEDWGVVRTDWLNQNISRIAEVLGYPLPG